MIVRMAVVAGTFLLACGLEHSISTTPDLTANMAWVARSIIWAAWIQGMLGMVRKDAR